MLPGLRQIVPQKTLLPGLFRLFDAAALPAALAWSLAMLALPAGEKFVLAAAVCISMFFLAAEITGLYRDWRGAPADREVLALLGTWSLTLAFLLTGAFLFRATGDFPRRLLLLWAVIAPVLMASSRLGLRMVQRFFHRRGFNTRGYAVVGVNELGIQLARNIQNAPQLGLKLVGFFDDRTEDRTPELPQEFGPRLGDLQSLVKQAKSGEVDTIYIALSMRAEERINSVLDRLADSTASVYIVPDFFVFELLHSRWTSIGGLPAVSVFENPLYGADGLLKRGADLLLAGLALLLLALPMAAIAALIKLTSPGPVFFRQRRYGMDGKEILVWKFRSMTVCENGEKVEQAKKGDKRVTPLGKILRSTSLDELPQLFNVVAGNMSLVGPRPHATAHNEQYRQLIRGYMLRHKVKPGITGLAQVNGWRGETDVLEKMEGRIACDHQYIREWSLWLDLKILCKTVLVVLSRQNAH